MMSTETLEHILDFLQLLLNAHWLNGCQPHKKVYVISTVLWKGNTFLTEYVGLNLGQNCLKFILVLGCFYIMTTFLGEGH